MSLFFSNSFITAFMRSSNCPLYFVPATKLAKSSVTTRLSYKILDTFRCIMRKASPSAIADFPTPGSPISRGLFFFRRLSICETRWISFSLPTTGSSLPSSAMTVKSLPKLSKTGVFDFLLVFELVPAKRFSFPESSAGASSLSFENSDVGFSI